MAEVDNINVMTGLTEDGDRYNELDEPTTYTNKVFDEAYGTVDVPTFAASIDISNNRSVVEARESRQKYDPEDLPWKRKYLYGLDKTGYPVCYRFIPKSKFDVLTIRQEMDTMLVKHHDIAMVFMVDNSKNLHEAFNRAKSGYRPAEDKAIFVEMLYQYGIKLFPVYAIDSIE